VLRGDRVTLRAVERDDLDALWRSTNDLEVEVLGGGFPPGPRSRAAIEAEFDRSHEDTSKIEFAIEADGKVIGFCGLRDIDTTARHCAFGISIFERDYWGRGYGREALELLVEYCFHHRNLNRVWLDVLEDNERARRAYRAVGFVEEGRLRQDAWNDGRLKDSIVMGLLREEWSGRAAPERARARASGRG
jgi:RimJ/RimL family protein N-acetyltransferase